MATEIITREEARAKGLKRYFTGKPCGKGHISERNVSGKGCIACSNIRSARWRRDNLDQARKAARESMRKWRADNPEAAKERLRKFYWFDPSRARIYARETYSRLRKKKLEAKKMDRIKRPDVHRENARRAYYNNYDKVVVYRRNRKLRKRGAGGTHTSADIKAILSAQSHKCAYCRTDLQKAKRHLDHIMPLALGGTNDRTNLQYLCAGCNLSKGAKHPIAFAQERGLLL